MNSHRFVLTSLLIVVLTFVGFASTASEQIPDPPIHCGDLLAKRIVSGIDRDSGPPIPPTDYDVEHYDLDLSLDFETESVDGSVEITARSLVPAFSLFRVDLRSNMTVSGVTREGTPLSFTHLLDRIAITLDQTFGIDELFAVRIEYSGQPINEAFSCFQFGEHAGIPIMNTLSEPWYARNWWPCKEDPSDKATADLSFTVPADMIAASNGTLVEVVDNGPTKTYHWQSSYPIATYLVSLTVSAYETFSEDYITAGGDTMSVDYFAYAEDLAEAQGYWLGTTVEHLEYFRSVYGEYPFIDEKYGIIEQLNGGIEHQTLTGLPDCCLGGSVLNSHELAHQWWGNMVTCATWHDIWLNEGFATFSSALWLDQEEPNGYKDFLDMLNNESGWETSVYRYDISDIMAIFFGGPIYNKGAWVLHMLRGVLGDEDFFGAIGAYREAFEYESATTEDFESAIEAYLGQSLGWFIDEWIYGVGRPDYEYTWWQPDSLGMVTVVIRQVHENAPPFKMPIEIDVETTQGVERFTVWDSLETQAFQLSVTSPVVSIEFDPDDWILDWHTEVPVMAVDHAPRSGDRTQFTSAWPSPFVSAVELSFLIPIATATPQQLIDLAVYDIGGRQVRTTFSGQLGPGRHAVTWDGEDDEGHDVGCGVYFVLLRSGKDATVRRIVKVE